jgi:hypothetical protein
MATLHIPHAEVAQHGDGISIDRGLARDKQVYVRLRHPAKTFEHRPAEVGNPPDVKRSSAPGEKRRRVSRPNIETMIDKTRRGWRPGQRT